MKIGKRLKRIERELTRQRVKFTRTLKVSGCLSALTPDGQEKELEYLLEKTKRELIRELEIQGHLRVIPLARTGDDKKVLVVLEV